KIDSLRNLLTNAKEDTTKINLLNALGKEYQNNHADTTILYSEQAKQLSRKIGYTDGEAYAFLNIGIAYDNLGDLKKSLDNYSAAKKLFLQSNNKSGLAKSYNETGIIYYEFGKFDSALTYYSLSLHLRDSLHEKQTL